MCLLSFNYHPSLAVISHLVFCNISQLVPSLLVTSNLFGSLRTLLKYKSTVIFLQSQGGFVENAPTRLLRVWDPGMVGEELGVITELSGPAGSHFSETWTAIKDSSSTQD